MLCVPSVITNTTSFAVLLLSKKHQFVVCFSLFSSDLLNCFCHFRTAEVEEAFDLLPKRIHSSDIKAKADELVCYFVDDLSLRRLMTCMY